MPAGMTFDLRSTGDSWWSDTKPCPKNLLDALLAEIDADLAAVPEDGRVAARERERQLFVPLHVGRCQVATTPITGACDGLVDGDGLIFEHGALPSACFGWIVQDVAQEQGVDPILPVNKNQRVLALVAKLLTRNTFYF